MVAAMIIQKKEDSPFPSARVLREQGFVISTALRERPGKFEPGTLEGVSAIKVAKTECQVKSLIKSVYDKFA